MPVEFAIWKIEGDQLKQIDPTMMDSEARLEAMLARDPALLGLDLLVLGRQVPTAYGKRIDLLGIDAEGDLHIVELKRDRTPREVVAQALDYASWVKGLSFEDVSDMFKVAGGPTFEQVFADRFGAGPPEAINENHHLVIVASDLDPSTERIVTYLSETHGVPINVVFFRYLHDDGREYLARTWLVDPQEAEARATVSPGARKRQPWNGQDFYVSFGDDERRSWEDARRYGFVSGGGGRWYSRTLSNLQPGHRVFVHIPEHGYVGVGIVQGTSRPISEFKVPVDDKELSLLEAQLENEGIRTWADDPERSEYLVRIEWLKTLPISEAIWEKGFFANQNTVCKMRSAFTLERLTQHFGLTE